LPFEVKPNELNNAVNALKVLNIAGINCTIPHKETVIEYLDEVSNEAKAIGAVNTIVNVEGKLHGYNTDGKGFMRSLVEIEPSGVRDKRIFLMGSGGAGRAIAVQSALDGAKSISLCDKDEVRASVLFEHLRLKFKSLQIKHILFEKKRIEETVTKTDIFIDATPLGMHPDDPISINVEWLKSGMLVVDLVYNPPETPLLVASKKRGCRTLNGLGMLLYQGALAFEIWTGMKPPIDVMRKALEEAVYK